MTKTVLLTGVTGFIAKRIALDLLNAGHTVRGSLRSMDRTDEVRDALRPHLDDPAALDRLDFVTLDLTQDAGWTDAMDGIDVLMHTASPFPMSSPKDEDDLIRPAVDGTLRALRAAQAGGVNRVILTSSVVAMEATDRDGPISEDDWTDLDHPRASAYYKSKTLAERAAWEFVKTTPGIDLTTINPALVLGAPLDRHYGTSLSLIERILDGKDPMIPNMGFGVVDVADISAMHLAAMDRDAAIGHRFIGCAGTRTMPQIARHLADEYPDRKIATRAAPKLLLRGLALFDPAIRGILPSLGSAPEFDTSQTRDLLGIDFTPPEVAIDRAAEAVVAQG